MCAAVLIIESNKTAGIDKKNNFLKKIELNIWSKCGQIFDSIKNNFWSRFVNKHTTGFNGWHWVDFIKVGLGSSGWLLGGVYREKTRVTTTKCKVYIIGKYLFSHVSATFWLDFLNKFRFEKKNKLCKKLDLENFNQFFLWNFRQLESLLGVGKKLIYNTRRI